MIGKHQQGNKIGVEWFVMIGGGEDRADWSVERLCMRSASMLNEIISDVRDRSDERWTTLWESPQKSHDTESNMGWIGFAASQIARWFRQL
jgi:hypothetical protein